MRRRDRPTIDSVCRDSILAMPRPMYDPKTMFEQPRDSGSESNTRQVKPSVRRVMNVAKTRDLFTRSRRSKRLRNARRQAEGLPVSKMQMR